MDKKEQQRILLEAQKTDTITKETEQRIRALVDESDTEALHQHQGKY